MNKTTCVSEYGLRFPKADLQDCKTCSATWCDGDLMKAGSLGNACCQECGYDQRVHGNVGAIFTNNEFGERQ